ncbi:hypothetical protein B7494_g160 [Chlorociboria aeruginascens]|nr:hypothetical protein B7494_g160 [Chlorociboria aeruginascens]
MASEAPAKSAKQVQEEFDIISNRIAAALARHENIVKSWTARSSRPQPPRKTQEEIDAEDAQLFRKEPPYLGVGATIPPEFLIDEAERSTKSLRNKLLPSKGLQASKARDDEEKADSSKRGLQDESSDEEEEGRSSLGKAKKLKTSTQLASEEAEQKVDKPGEQKVEQKENVTEDTINPFATPPSTPDKGTKIMKGAGDATGLDDQIKVGEEEIETSAPLCQEVKEARQ